MTKYTEIQKRDCGLKNKKMKSTQFNLAIIIVLIPFLLKAQESIITLTTDHTGGTYEKVARNAIFLKPGFQYVAVDTNTFWAHIGQYDIDDIEYTEVNCPETRDLETGYLVGTTPGTFNVTPIGGASYTIPIDLPSGVAGLQPNLTITYNSHAGSGIAGYGWNISGISAITRSPQTYYHDSVSIGVNLTATDRFSLDGQRLIFTHGIPIDKHYRTETDIFADVFYSYYHATDKWYYKARTKDGKTYEYGYNSNSQQVPEEQDEVLTWYVNKITDIYGNEINYEYLRDRGMVYPNKITYGPNTITFRYKERLDQQSSYIVGKEIVLGFLLESIEISYNSNVIKKYELLYNYPASNYTQYSLLNEVIEYAGGNRLNSTVFCYETPDEVDFGQTTYNDTHDYISYKSRLAFGDFNGDGLKDVFTTEDPDVDGSYSGWKMYINNGNGTFTLNDNDDFSMIDESKATATAVDLNGDNMEDLFIRVFDGTGAYCGGICDAYSYFYSISNGNSFGNLQYITTEYYPVSTLAGVKIENSILESNQIDFDGDGLADILIRTNSGWKLYGFTFDGVNLSFNLKNSDDSGLPGDEHRFGDINGDGKVELWAFDGNGLRIFSYDDSTFEQIYNSSIPKNNHFFNLGDFNTDGKTDMFIYGYDDGSAEYDWSDWQIHLSTGTGFVTKTIPQNKSNLKDDIVRVGDFNGDGASDLMVMATDDAWNGHYYYVSKNQGGGFYSHLYSLAQSSTHNYFIEDIDGDGRDDYLCTDGESAWWNGYMIYKSGSINNSLLKRINNGLNRQTEISYNYLSASGSNYTKGSGASFPVFDFQGALSVVSSVSTDNGLGGQTTVNYDFEGAKMHRQGKGFLCFTKQTSTNTAGNIISENNFNYDTDYYYRKLLSTVTKAGSNIISTSGNQWGHTVFDASKKWLFPYVSSNTQTDNLTGHTVSQSFVYDDYGNPTKIIKSYNNGVTDTTRNYYTNDSPGWLLGRVDSIRVTYTKNGETQISRKIGYTYGADGILQPDFIKYFEGTEFYRYTDHDYDDYGNLIQTVEYGNGSGSRQTNYSYDSHHVRIDTIIDPLGNITAKFYNTSGRLSSEVDYLGNTTSYSYDDMGRQTGTTLPDGATSSTSYNWELYSGVNNAVYSTTTTGNDGSETKIWYDILGREIRSDIKGFDGSPIYTVTNYNTKGQVTQVSEPDTAASPAQWTMYAYDPYGRIDSIVRPSGMNSYFDYNSNRVTEITAGQTSWKETDSQGLVTQAHDDGGTITYAYYPDGQVKTITAPGGIQTSMEYNITGNQTNLTDPSAGTIRYSYNAFGQLDTMINASDSVTIYSYYADGRVNTKTTAKGTTTYSYNGNDQLSGISSTGGLSLSYSYDDLGRTDTITENIPGSSAFYTIFGYDNKGRLSSRKHPSGIVEEYVYNNYGYLSSVKANNITLWTASEMNQRQQITSAQFGSNLAVTYAFDDYGFPDYTSADTIMHYDYTFNIAKGWLTARENLKHSGTKENFGYDGLNRLTQVYDDNQFDWLEMDYDANGKGNLEKIVFFEADTLNMEYGVDAGPYAVTGANLPEDSVLFAMMSTPQRIAFNTFEQPDTITEAPWQAVFTYNNDEQRAKMEVFENTTPKLTRWYVGSRYMKEDSTGTVKEYTWIGGDAYSAPVLGITQSGNTSYYYLLRDYLGSITHVVDATDIGNFSEYSYDAWGRRRVADDWTNYDLTTEPELFADRGFTGHEHLSWFDLVNMNGRLYDPLLGRFLSPDEYVQMPDFSQNFNRYSYAFNNPLAFADKSGEVAWFPIIALAIQQAIVGGARANLQGENIVEGAFKGGAIGGLTGYIGAIGSNIAGILPGLGFGATTGAGLGAIDAWAFGGDVGQQALWGGVIGGTFGGLSGYSNAASANKLFADIGIDASMNVWTGKITSGSFYESIYNDNLFASTSSQGSDYNDYTKGPINIKKGRNPVGDIFARTKYLYESGSISSLHDIVVPQGQTWQAPVDRYSTRIGTLGSEYSYKIRQHIASLSILKEDPSFFKIRRTEGIFFGPSPKSRTLGFHVVNYINKPLLSVEVFNMSSYFALQQYFKSLNVIHPFDISRFLNK